MGVRMPWNHINPVLLPNMFAFGVLDAFRLMVTSGKTSSQKPKPS